MNDPCGMMDVARFAFPFIPELPQNPPASDATTVVWPECNDAQTVSACAEMADAILQQLSGDDASFRFADHPKVVMLTSAGDGDGKTGLLLALAPQIAKQFAGGILVIDANFRKPDLTARLEMPADHTTRQSSLIYPTNLRQLNVLPAPAGTTTHHFDRSWIEEFQERWPLVLLDAPSLANPEVASLASCCDGVYLAVRLGYTSRRAVAQAARVVRHSGGRLLGCLAIR